MKIDIGANKLKVINFVNLSYDESLQILQMRNDKRIAKWMLNESEITQNEHLAFIERLKRQQNRLYLAIKHEDDDYFLGVISLSDIDNINKNAFIGIYANPNMLHHKNAVGHQLMEILKHISFHRFAFHIVFAKCLSDNLTALRFYKKENFFECGILPESVKKGDKFIDTILLALKKE